MPFKINFIFVRMMLCVALFTLFVTLGCGSGPGGDDPDDDEQITTLTWDQNNWNEVDWK